MNNKVDNNKMKVDARVAGLAKIKKLIWMAILAGSSGAAWRVRKTLENPTGWSYLASFFLASKQPEIRALSEFEIFCDGKVKDIKTLKTDGSLAEVNNTLMQLDVTTRNQWIKLFFALSKSTRILIATDPYSEFKSQIYDFDHICQQLSASTYQEHVLADYPDEWKSYGPYRNI